MTHSTTTKTPDFHALIDIIKDPFMIIDRNYKIVAANRQYCRHYGVNEDQVVGRHCYQVSHRVDVPCDQNGEPCPMREVFGKNRPTDVTHIHYDKHGQEERVHLHATPLASTDGSVDFMGEFCYPETKDDTGQHLLIGRSPAMLRLISILQRVAPTQTTVLLLGDSGVGKECSAKYIHHYSDRHEQPFIVVDCSTLGEQLIESELFGHEKGAFTNAVSRKRGLFEVANHGTLFIDEISELPLHLQTKLLRVLDTGSLRRLGGTEYIDVDIRVIAASNQNLKGN